MNIVYVASPLIPSELAEIRALGFDTAVVYGATPVQLDLLAAAGLQCLYHLDSSDRSVMAHTLAETREHPALYGYYLYDEPELQGITPDMQDELILAVRQHTTKPLALAMIEETERQCSLNFDLYMPDIYWYTRVSWKGHFVKLANYANLYFSTLFFRVLYPGRRFIPIVGLYNDPEGFEYTPEQLRFARYFIRCLGSGCDFAAFIWNNVKPGYNGIVNTPEYRDWAAQLCSEVSVGTYAAPGWWFRLHRWCTLQLSRVLIGSGFVGWLKRRLIAAQG